MRYPRHKLEWLGVGERARLVRRDLAKKASNSNKEETKNNTRDKKGKGRAITVGGADYGLEEVSLEVPGVWSDGEGGDEEIPDQSESDSDADDTADEFEEMLKLRSIRWGLEHIEGVKVFEKEVRAGEL